MERMLADTTTAANGAARTQPKISTVIAELRRTSLFRQVVPMEAGIGWPIPIRRDGVVYLTLPLFGFGRAATGKRQIELYAPFAAITLDYKTSRAVKYVNFTFEKPWPQATPKEAVGVFPHEAIATLTTAEYSQKREQLLAMYDELFASLGGGAEPSEEWNGKFSALLKTMVEPSLEPYYRTLGERFFDRFVGAPAR